MNNLVLDLIRVAMPLENNYVSDTELSEYDIESIKHMQAFAYWYGNGGYEGSGHCIYQTQDNKWDEKSLSHCSCYGPMDGLSNAHSGAYNTLDKLVSSFSPELKHQTATLVQALKARGY